MEQLIYLFLFFSLLFLLESKPINILIAFIGILLSLCFLLSYQESVYSIGAEYYTFILILVQVSALTILFGFLIMVYPIYSENKFFYFFEGLNKYFFIIPWSLILGLFFYYSSDLFIQSSFSTYGNIISNISHSENSLFYPDSVFIRKLGIMLYSIDSNIIKLLLITLILLLAIIALFFLIVY